jgi:hypothetical protein
MLSEAISEVARAEEAARDVPLSSPPASGGNQAAAKLFDPPTTPNRPAIITQTQDGRDRTSPLPGARSSAPAIRSPAPRSPAPSEQSRRELLARRLTGKSSSVQIPNPPKLPTPGYAKAEDAVDALRRRYEDKVSAKRSAQARKYTDVGMEARAKGDMVAAANALRVAIEFDPENAELQAAQREAQQAADGILVEQYLKQAEYEERSERWADAGRSWTRVARTRPSDARAHERAAHCVVKASGNLHEAAAMGQRAVQLEPRNPAFRRTLANVYLSAGLALNAKRELEAALQLAPNDATTAALLKRIAKSS